MDRDGHGSVYDIDNEKEKPYLSPPMWDSPREVGRQKECNSYFILVLKAFGFYFQQYGTSLNMDSSKQRK